MKLFLACIVFLFLGIIPASAWPRGGTATFGTSYFISPTGSDSNNGLSAGSPWLTPNHAVNCGDVINAAPGTYAGSNFGPSHWGAVSSCPSASGIYFAQVKCSGLFVEDCKYAGTGTNDYGAWIDQSNWALVTGKLTSVHNGCGIASPSAAAGVHHIAFINVEGPNCLTLGFGSSPYFGGGQFGVDYFAVVGAIAYNSAAGTTNCPSGISAYEPVASDSVSGTHQFFAGIFSFANLNVQSCAGGSTTSDGNGIILDDWQGDQSGFTPYAQQGAIEQSMFLGNGGGGAVIFNNPSAPVFIKNVTTWGNAQDTHHATSSTMAELNYNSAKNTSTTNGIFQATLATQNTNNVYGANVFAGDGTDTIGGNYIFGVGGQNTNIISSPGFSFGSNTTATPNFVAPSTPSAPNCATAVTTTACMSATVANFVAQAGGAAGLGYQPPGSCAPDALYPVWLKGVVPNGIITKPCGL